MMLLDFLSLKINSLHNSFLSHAMDSTFSLAVLSERHSLKTVLNAVFLVGIVKQTTKWE